MDSFILAVNAVFPIFLIMGAGYVLRIKKLMDDHTVSMMNRVVFQLILPVMMFSNVARTDLREVFRPRLLLFGILSLTAVFLVCMLIVPRFIKDNKQRSTVIMCSTRGNIVMIGVPMALALVGPEQIGTTSLAIAVFSPFANVLSVFVLEFFRGGRPDPLKILKGVVTNPLVVGSALGLLVSWFGIPFPAFLWTAIGDIAKTATPLSLLVLGGSFEFSRVGKNRSQLVFGILLKMFIIPGVMVPLCIMAGFRGHELVPLIVLFVAPTATSTFPMAAQMGGDGELAGQLVVFGSAICLVTFFVTVFLVSYLGYL